MKLRLLLLFLILVTVSSGSTFGMMSVKTITVTASQKPKFIELKVKRKQTVFSIARQYGITMEELYRHNPSAKKGIQVGQTLRIPVRGNEQPKEPTKPDIQETQGEHEQDQNKTKYFTYKIKPGDTLFDLEKKYDMPSDSLVAINPQLQKGVLPGSLIKIPGSRLPVIISEPEKEKEFIRYTVHSDESVYDIASRFEISINELKNANPELKYRELLKGEELLIPDKSLRKKIFDKSIQDSIWVLPGYKIKHRYQGLPEPCNTNSESKGKTYQVALLLPLFLDANDTINRMSLSNKELLADSAFMNIYKRGASLPKDTFRIRKEKIIDPRSENFMHFYEGVLMAVDSLRKQGKKFELFVFDTERDSMVIRSLIQQDIFREMDLILGPVFPEMQSEISAFSAKNRIPMVSPLSSSGNFEKKNPYYFKVNPDKEYLIRQTASWVADEFFDKNFIVFRIGDYRHLQEAELVNQCREKLFATGYYNKHREVLFHECNFETEGISGIKNILSQKLENVFIIPAVNEGQISVAVTNLNSLAEQTNVRLVGLSGFKGYRSIQPEYFHRTQLQYMTHYFIDYESVPVNRFIAAFKKQFATEPNEFSFQGFDLAYYFMNALHKYGKDMPRCISNFRMELNQLSLNFQRVSKTGGFMNYGLVQVAYEKDFSIKNKGLYGPNNLLPLKSPAEN
ncbi:MAG: hypothetical protein A2W90_24030 [Bacteroidetes bacterium GWF2_42_66]|nr:MAG: hypothetical protein A2W92_16150 [Bacteroidetes bacterium GWA2_42_15]OFY00253.1 MAG: hypothetical protein A2W89_13635 [Bacteroidetes bacterium GWE2_42_39]OFY47177.1 MAG: hypothetical protein A2W90_24030 [Bacteroidetes bacterium GWF2_42_66]HBL76629.1 hypothetical protein [Prolixibacteraceae bacterium]HCR88920.1 hypothetical protein [Prolixibacteraceae bacterium]